jgi:very-short-patch-repair endonuclease
MKRIHNNESLKERRRALRRNATPQEARMWEYLRNKQLGYKFRRQHSIGVYITDFYCPEKELVIELDGKFHEETKEYDLERDYSLQKEGLYVLRIANAAVDRDIFAVIMKIKEILAHDTPLRRRRGAGGEVC